MKMSTERQASFPGLVAQEIREKGQAHCAIAYRQDFLDKE
jgi:hypothetical protein